MCVDVAHLVFETPCDTDNQVVYEGLDGTKGCDILAGTVVEFDVDRRCVWSGEADGEMREIFD